MEFLGSLRNLLALKYGFGKHDRSAKPDLMCYSAATVLCSGQGLVTAAAAATRGLV